MLGVGCSKFLQIFRFSSFSKHPLAVIPISAQTAKTQQNYFQPKQFNLNKTACFSSLEAMFTRCRLCELFGNLAHRLHPVLSEWKSIGREAGKTYL